MTDQKIMFFDIDGTLLPENIPGAQISPGTIHAIRKARNNGHLMFINSGRCMQNIEKRFLDIGFDGVVAGCGTNIYYHGQELFHAPRSQSICRQVLELARKYRADIVFESKERMSYDHKMHYHDFCRSFLARMSARGYDLSQDVDQPGFQFDKFVIWAEEYCELQSFLDAVAKWYQIIPRGGKFYEFVPMGYSKATGIQFLLDRFRLPLSAAYAIGDSLNDLPMLEYVPGSIAMGNSHPDLFQKVSYVTTPVDKDGIQNALEHFHFI